MASLHLEITNIAGFVSAWTAGNLRKEAGSQSQLVCSVYPIDRDHLDLETGEIFQSPRYLKVRGQQDKGIAGQLIIYEGKDSGEDSLKAGNWNEITYLGGHESKDDPDSSFDSLIYFRYTLPQNEFVVLHNHVSAGHLPKRVLIECEENAFNFGWEPDGSGQNWNNLTKKKVRISEIRFDFSYSESDETTEESLSELIDKKDYKDTAKVARAIIERLNSLEKIGKWVLVLIGLCAALLLKSWIH